VAIGLSAQASQSGHPDSAALSSLASEAEMAARAAVGLA
jgi:hypothetical protein